MPTERVIEDPVEAFHTLWFSGAAGVLHSRDERERALADPGLLEIAHVGERLTALDYVRATAARADLGRRMGQFHQEFDILLTPTMPIDPLARCPHRHACRLSRRLRSPPLRHTTRQQRSTRRRQARILVDVHPGPSGLGVGASQPQPLSPVPGEQPS